MTDFIVYSVSFAPAGTQSQSGYSISIHLSFGHTRHLIHWQAVRATNILESSAEAELTHWQLPGTLLATFGASRS